MTHTQRFLPKPNAAAIIPKMGINPIKPAHVLISNPECSIVRRTPNVTKKVANID